ncbi:unnamed protein product [Spodoptera littoralis]|uniref:Band 7 domain-containing protein n=1 Tax=Spodoptera littoralis TaxID=7109 RepID=A0A9P0IE09_SPOLI|nr:unnamed protein product [Spodoptera littoralis]CAH1644474.1 unnamed protein product [Spodoptera littoralis]
MSSTKSSKLQLSDDKKGRDDVDLDKELLRSPNIFQEGYNFNTSRGNKIYHDKFIEKCLVIISVLFVLVAFPISLFTIFVVVRQFERAVILRNGKLRKNKAYGPGLIQYLPCVDTIKYVDLRIICYAVPPQEALTKDALTVAVDAVVYYKIDDPIWAVVNIADYKVATQYLAATTLRNALGTRKLSEILIDRPAVSYQVFGNMKHLTTNWGVKVVRFEVKDISLPLQLQKTMATEAESSRLANAKIIVAKAEIESTKNLQKATSLLMDNPYCMQLRYLQALQMIAGERTHTVVLPITPEMLKGLYK